MRVYQIFVYDEVSKKWYGNETFKKNNVTKLAMTCYDYGVQGVDITIRTKEVKEDETKN